MSRPNALIARGNYRQDTSWLIHVCGNSRDAKLQAKFISNVLMPKSSWKRVQVTFDKMSRK